MDWDTIHFKDEYTRALRMGVEFSSSTDCKTLELLYPDSLADPQWIEAAVDDGSLHQWLEWVSVSCRSCDMD